MSATIELRRAAADDLELQRVRASGRRAVPETSVMG
jgi:hypothetical protein